MAISGLLYRAFANHLEADPGDLEIWQRVQEANDYALNGHPLTIETFPGEGRIRLLEERFGGLVDLLADAGQALTDAANKLERNATGDYSPNSVAGRFPPWEQPKPVANTISIHDVFDRWQKERKPSASTISTWRGCVDGFVAHLGHNDMSRVSRRDVVAWKDALIERGLTPHNQTVKDGHLAAIKALFRFAIDSDDRGWRHAKRRRGHGRCPRPPTTGEPWAPPTIHREERIMRIAATGFMAFAAAHKPAFPSPSGSSRASRPLSRSTGRGGQPRICKSTGSTYFTPPMTP